jgi:hypothetical protein
MKPVRFPKRKRGRYQHGSYYPSGGEAGGCQKPTTYSPNHQQAHLSHVPFSKKWEHKNPLSFLDLDGLSLLSVGNIFIDKSIVCF